MDRIEKAKQDAGSLAASRYSGARCVILAGSVIRGEGTASSDLDLVVVYERLPCARRESFTFEGWPVEAFVQDPETLRYFTEEFDVKSKRPVLPTMVAEGVCVFGDVAYAESLKWEAQAKLDAGPPPQSREDIDRYRYMITDMIDDIREPRSADELVATGVALYGPLSEFYLLSRGFWMASRKMIPRKLSQADPALGRKFTLAFNGLFSGNAEEAIALAEEILQPHGGFLFDGYSSDAPVTARKPLVGR